MQVRFDFSIQSKCPTFVAKTTNFDMQPAATFVIFDLLM